MICSTGKGGDLGVQGQGSESLDHVTGPKKEKSPFHRRGLRRKKGNQPRIFRRIKTEKKRRTERNRKRGQKQRKGDLRIKTEPKKRNWKKKKNAKEKGRRKNKKKRKEKEKEKGKGKEKGNERNAKEKRRGKGKRNEKENDKGNRSVKKSESEAEQDQGVHHCHHHLKGELMSTKEFPVNTCRSILAMLKKVHPYYSAELSLTALAMLLVVCYSPQTETEPLDIVQVVGKVL